MKKTCVVVGKSTKLTAYFSGIFNVLSLPRPLSLSFLTFPSHLFFFSLNLTFPLFILPLLSCLYFLLLFYYLSLSLYLYLSLSLISLFFPSFHVFYFSPFSFPITLILKTPPSSIFFSFKIPPFFARFFFLTLLLFK